MFVVFLDTPKFGVCQRKRDSQAPNDSTMFDSLQITICLWFDDQAEAAANYYVYIFKNSTITHIQRYTESGRAFHGHEPGTVLVVEYNLNGHRFVNMNGGPQMKHTGATSFMIMWRV